VNKRVGDAIKQGKKLDEIVKMDGARAVSTTISMPDSVKKYVAAGFPGIVLGTYNEITQKKASGDLPH
jgi:hypothetical protein